MYVLGLDLETDSLEIEEANIIEIGAVIWSVEEKIPLECFSPLVFCGDTYTVPEEISRLTGIHSAHLLGFGMDIKEALVELSAMMAMCSCIVAHNGNEFDRPILERAFDKYQVPYPPLDWVDTMTDVPYPDTMTTRKLTYLAAEHGFINSFAHRALFDVLTMFKVLSFYDFNEVLAISKEPFVTLRAMCYKPWEDSGASTGVAKRLGYRWDGERKLWLKKVKQHKVESELQATNEIKLVVLE